MLKRLVILFLHCTFVHLANKFIKMFRKTDLLYRKLVGYLYTGLKSMIAFEYGQRFIRVGRYWNSIRCPSTGSKRHLSATLPRENICRNRRGAEHVRGTGGTRNRFKRRFHLKIIKRVTRNDANEIRMNWFYFISLFQR